MYIQYSYIYKIIHLLIIGRYVVFFYVKIYAKQYKSYSFIVKLYFVQIERNMLIYYYVIDNRYVK